MPKRPDLSFPGARNGHWKGGGSVRADGRRLAYVPGHPRADKRNYVLDYILRAERALGRPLPSAAVVHHLDGDARNSENHNLVSGGGAGAPDGALGSIFEETWSPCQVVLTRTPEDDSRFSILWFTLARISRRLLIVVAPLCENQAYHVFLHRRLRAWLACGHPSWIRCRDCGEWRAPADILPAQRRYQLRCIPCSMSPERLARNHHNRSVAATKRWAARRSNADTSL